MEKFIENPRFPKISIVTPSYNQGKFLEETIRSVLLQDYPNLEYIIIDGGSTDNSVEIIKKYEKWLTYWVSEQDKGQTDAIAKGFEMATGDIYAWINSDDRYRPRALFRVGDFFKRNPSIIFANGDVNMIDEEGHILFRINALKPNYLITANLGKHGWPQQGCFWRASAYAKVGGMDRNLKFCMDRDLFLRLVRAGPCKRIPGPPLADFREHDNAKSTQWLDIAKEENEQLITKYGSSRMRRHKNFLELYWKLLRIPVFIRRMFE